MLNIDKFFYAALSIYGAGDEVEGRIFNPARTEAEEDEDKIPYIILSYDGGSSGDDTCDCTLSTLRNATVSILCVAEDRDALADLTEAVSSSVQQAFDDEIDSNNWQFIITSAIESASGVSLDPSKPCCYQTLSYQCETEPK